MHRIIVLAFLAMLMATGTRADYLTETWKTALSKEAEESSLKGHFVEVKVGRHNMAMYVTTMIELYERRHPAVIIAHHAVGIYHHTFLRKFADDLASHGFFVVLPDLFHRVWSDEVPHGHKMPFEKMNIKAMLDSLRDVQIEEDLAAALGWISEQPAVSPGKKGIVGFCMGGRIAWLAAIAPALQSMIGAAVPYHGGNVFKGLGDGAQPPSESIAGGLQIPVLGHFGSIDSNPSAADMKKLQELAGSKLEAKVYEGADHGFSCEDSSKYVAPAAKEAFDLTVKYLRDQLPPSHGEWEKDEL